MKQTIVKRFGFYFGATLLMVAVWGIESYMQSGGTVYAETPIQDRAVDAFSQMNRLLITLGTSILGAMGLLLSNGFRGRACTREMWAAIAGALFVAVSIYYGYVANLVVLSMLSTGHFDPYNSALTRTHGLHFVTFMTGVMLFAGFVYQNLITEDGHEDSHDVTGS
jgi:hypothetical protein